MTGLVAKELTFIKKKHELDKMLKSLEKMNPTVLKVLDELFESEDIPLKTKAEYALKTLELQSSVVKQINADEMARLVAEYKIGSGGKLIGRGSTAEETDSTPALDFDTIREV